MLWDIFAVLGIIGGILVVLGLVGYGLLWFWAKSMGMPD